MFSSKRVREKRIDEWLDSITPIGENPLDKVTVYKTRASEFSPYLWWPDESLLGAQAVDECDFNGHLSNSSYAKVCILRWIFSPGN